MGVHPTLRRAFPTKPTLRPAPILYCGVPSHTPCTAVYFPLAPRRTLPHLCCRLPFSCTAMRFLYFIPPQTLHCGLPPSCTAACPPTPALWPTPPLHCCDAILLYFFAVTLGRRYGWGFGDYQIHESLPERLSKRCDYNFLCYLGKVLRAGFQVFKN